MAKKATNQVRIKKVCLEIGSKKIELTLKQAQELKDVLNETFGEEVTEYVYRDRWNYPQQYPWWTYTPTCLTSDTITGSSGAYPGGNTVTTTSGLAQVPQWSGSIANNTVTFSTQEL